MEGNEQVRYCKVMVHKDGGINACDFPFTQKLGGERSTGSLLFHFSNHHPAVFRLEQPEKYEEYVKAGKMAPAAPGTKV